MMTSRTSAAMSAPVLRFPGGDRPPVECPRLNPALRDSVPILSSACRHGPSIRSFLSVERVSLQGMRRFTVGHRRCGPSRLLLGLLLVPLVVLLSSCVRYQSSIDIKSKDDITVNVDVAMQTSSLGLGGMPTSPEEFCQDISSSAGPKITITPYADDAYTGCRITAAGSLDDGVISNAGMGDTLQLVDGVWVYRSAPGARVGDRHDVRLLPGGRDLSR